MNKLALLGGEPVRTKSFPDWPVYDEREEKALLEVLHSGMWGITPEDGFIEKFEIEFAAAHHARFGRCVANGTLALETALRAIGIDYGDEVILPPYTFLATATACLSVGAIPIFVDIEPGTYNLDAEKIEAALTPRTRAIIPVHIGGNPANLDRILEIANQHGLRVIEDACQAHGAAWKGRRVGAIGDLGCFSFQSSKNINAGEGGMILSDQEELAEMCWSIRNCGRQREGRWYAHEIMGANYRLTGWQAAILSAQLTRFEDLGRLREANGLYLAQQLSRVGGFEPLVRDARVTQHGYHLFISRYNPESFDELPRLRFLEALRAEGIPCSECYVPLYRMPAIQDGMRRLKRFLAGDKGEEILPECPVTEKACFSEGVWFFQTMLLGSTKDMDDIVRAVLKIKEQAKSISY